MEGIVIGHSFVRGFYAHLGQPSPSKAAKILKIDDRIQCVKFVGRRGLMVEEAAAMELREVEGDIKILDLGTNDLASGKSAEELVF